MLDGGGDRFLGNAVEMQGGGCSHCDHTARLELALDAVQALHLVREVLERAFQAARFELDGAQSAGERARLGDRLTYIGGLPTAETFALPYLEMGVTTYSSAIFNFVPEFALNFYKAVRARDYAKVYAALNEFVLPYINIRNRKQGYAVSIVKAGMKVVGRDAGPVRTPLTDLTEAEVAELAALVARIKNIVF